MPGRQYRNRNDLRLASNQKTLPAQGAPGQPYGARGRQEAALAAVPVPTDAAARSDLLRRAQEASDSFQPRDRLPLDRETERPDEPLTSGSALGPGPGPEVLGLSGSGALDVLRKIYLQTRSEAIRELIEDLEIHGE